MGQYQSNYHQHNRGNDRNNQTERVEDIWKDYLKSEKDCPSGYFDRNGNLVIDYVSRDKVERLVQAMAQGYPKLTMGQLRRFFQHCRKIESLLKSGESDWEHVRSRFLFLDAAAQDAYGKASKKIPPLFYDFIKRNVNAVKTQKDFLEGFLPHFEALVGFGSAHIEKERN